MIPLRFLRRRRLHRLRLLRRQRWSDHLLLVSLDSLWSGDGVADDRFRHEMVQDAERGELHRGCVEEWDNVGAAVSLSRRR